MKRSLSLFLCVALALSLAPCAAFAEADAEGIRVQPDENAPAAVSGSDAALTPVAEPGTEDAVEEAPEETPEDGSLPQDGEEDAGGEGEVISASSEWTNPLYESIDFSKCSSAVSSPLLKAATRARTYEAALYTSVDAAAGYLRAQMKNRVNTISLSYKTYDEAFSSADIGGKKTYISRLSLEIFHAAVEHTGVPTEGDFLYFACPGMYCTMSWSAATNVITLTYYMTTASAYNQSPRVIIGLYTTAVQESVLTEKVRSIITGLSLGGKSDFEKVRAVYEYICANVRYDHEHDGDYLLKYTAYAAAIDGSAVCQGIAALFYRLVMELGIDARIIAGGNHAWNIVELNDKYYYMDATWDVDGGNTARDTWEWFLIGEDSFGGHSPESKYEAAEFADKYPRSAINYVGATDISLDLAGIASGEAEVYIDGVPYTTEDGSLTLPDVTAKSAVVFTYNKTDGDRHTVYPTGMYVWMLSYADGTYTADRLERFDDILQYSGSSIRLTGKRGIRMISAVPTKLKTALTGAGINGYTLLEYGTIVAWADALGDGELVKGAAGVLGNHAYSKTLDEDPVFKSADGLTQYTNVLTFTDTAKCIPDLAMRPYMILEDSDGVYVTLYGGIIYRNIGYIAYQNRDVFSTGTEPHSYIKEIIDYVYPNGYAA